MSTQVRPGYKLTEVGVIPDNWEVCRLADLLEEGRHIRYGVVQPGTFVSDGCFMLRSQDYSKGWSGEDGMHRLSKLLEAQFKNAKLNAGDIVMTVVGAGIGQVEVIPSWLEGAVLSRSTARIAVDVHKSEKNFVKYYLESPVITKQLRDSQREGAQPVVSCPDLSDFIMAYPPRLQQNAIASVLTDMDALIRGLDQLVAKKRDIKQATMQKLLTGQQRLPGFSGEWKARSFGDLVERLEAGISVNSVDESLRQYGHVQSILKTSAVSNGNFFPLECKKIAPIDLKRTTTSPLSNTILISRMNTPDLVGESGYVEQDYPWLFLPDRLWMTHFRKESDINVKWLSYVLSSPEYKLRIRSNATGTSGSMKNISKGTLLSLSILLPSGAEQAAIATVLSDMDSELTALETRRDKARQLKQGMMQELLTGRIRLL